MLKIRNSLLSPTNITRFVGIIYGTSGVGKSTLAATAPRPLFLDMEKSTRFFELNGVNADIVDIASWKELGQIVAEVAASKDHDSIIIDSLTSAIELLKQEMILEDKRAGKVMNIQTNGQLTLMGYGVATNRLKAMMKVFADIEKNVIFTAHSATKTVDDVSKTIPLLVSKDSDALLGSYFINCVGHMPNQGIITFKPSNSYYTKDASGKLRLLNLSGSDCNFKTILNAIETKVSDKKQ